MLKINSDFDGGNIEVVDLNDPQDIRLKICRDTCSDFLQWFYFSLEGAQGQDCIIQILNASETSYSEGWEGYQALACDGGPFWARVDTEYDGKSLIIRLQPQTDQVYFAYFTPYSLSDHQSLIERAQGFSHCQLNSLGKTVQGRDLSLLCFGKPANGVKKVWIIARQHPGESMAEWFMQGLLERFLCAAGSYHAEIFSKYVFYIVPNMNPDGSFLGNLRSNAAGVNLNREWMSPDLDKSPEVFWVRNKMEETGVDLFLDIHGDEEIPYCFLSGCEGIPGYSGKRQAMEARFGKALAEVNPDFQTLHGYEPDLPGQANLGIAANWVGHRFDCLSSTLEMPFKDNLQVPDGLYGWSAGRSQKLGASVLDVIKDFDGL